MLVERHQTVAFRTAVRDLRRRRRRRGRRPGRRSSRPAPRSAASAPGAPFRPWLLTIVANEARNRRRAAGRRTALALRAAAEPAAPIPLPEAAALAGRAPRAAGRARPARPRAPPGDRAAATCSTCPRRSARRRSAAARAPSSRGCRGRSGACGWSWRGRLPELEARLRALADDVVWPATPDLAARRRPRRRASPRAAQAPHPRARSPPWLAALLLVPAGRRRVPRRARRRARVARPARRRDPPRAVAARGRPARAGGRPRPPRHARAGAARGRASRRRSLPGSARPTASAVTGQRISLVYAPRPGLPALEGVDAGLILTESRGGIPGAYLQKLLLRRHGGRAGQGPRRARRLHLRRRARLHLRDPVRDRRGGPPAARRADRDLGRRRPRAPARDRGATRHGAAHRALRRAVREATAGVRERALRLAANARCQGVGSGPI